VFGVVYAAEDSDVAVLEAVARDFSPRIEVVGDREIAIDLIGVERLFGDATEIATSIRSTAADRGLRVRVAMASTRTTARLIVHHRAGITVIDPGMETSTVAPLPLALLGVLRKNANGSNVSNESNDLSALLLTLRRWGLRTLGEFATLPSDDVAARLGQVGVWWQRIAAGEDPLPLVPSVPEERFEQTLELEWPIDGLEPLSFVLGRLMEPLERHLEQRDRGAAVLHVRLTLVKGAGGQGTRPVHERSLQLPTPIRDARTLRTLALLDLESHPPTAAIERVTVAVDPTPGRIVQYSLLTRPLPSPEQISTLMARLNALMGEGRCGAPATVDSWRPGAFAMERFAPEEIDRSSRPNRSNRSSRSIDVSALNDSKGSNVPVVALRRFRLPIPARVHIESGKPTRVLTDRRGLSGGRVEQCAGPWRTSGSWWTGDGGEGGDLSRHDGPRQRTVLGKGGPGHRSLGGGGWDRDEWDVTLNDGATYRVFRERDSGHWFLEGIVD
jgi:protein ImuB